MSWGVITNPNCEIVAITQLMLWEFSPTETHMTMLLYNNTFIGIHNDPKSMFSSCAEQKKKSREINESRHNKATKTFQKISVVGVNE